MRKNLRNGRTSTKPSLEEEIAHLREGHAAHKPDTVRWQRILNVPVRFVLGLFFSSLAAWLGSIPLVAYYFHIFTPISTIANVVAVPLCVLVLASNLISLSLAAWFPLGAELFNHIGWHLMNWIDVTSRWFASWPHAYAYVPMPNLFTIIVYYAVLLAVLTGWLFKSNRRAWKLVSTSVLMVAWCGQWLYQRSATHITVLPLGSGNVYFALDQTCTPLQAPVCRRVSARLSPFCSSLRGTSRQ